ncbi:MAG: hypothetical protein ACKO0Z_04315 [Betaproteobacteria bacterium]
MGSPLNTHFCNALGLPLYTSASNYSFNGTGLGLAFIFPAQTTSAITGVRFRYGARTGTPPTYSFGMETLSISLKPTGTDVGGGSPTLKTFTPPASTAWDGLVQQVDFTNSYTPATKDEWLAFVIRHSSGTCDASNFSSFSFNWGGGPAAHGPGHETLSAGTWSSFGATHPMVSWITASQQYGFLLENLYNTTTGTGTGRRSGAYFTVPTTLGTSVTVSGCNFIGTIANGSAANPKVVILDTSNNELASTTIEPAVYNSVSTARNIYAWFPTPVTLQTGTKYRVAIESTGGVANDRVGMHALMCATSGDKALLPLGANIGQALWDGSTWTEDALIHPEFELLLNDVTVPAGGGAGAIVIGTGGSVIRGLR